MTRRPFVTAAAAAQALKRARALGLTIPAPVTDAEAFCAEVERLALTLDPPRPPLPDRPEHLAALVADHVTATAAAAHSRNVAATFRRDTNERFITAVQDAVPAWITEMLPAFADAVDTFTDAAAHIPDGTTPDELGRLTADQFAHWQDADTAAYQLDALTVARREADRLTGEPVTGRFVDLAAASQVTVIPDGGECRATWEQISAALKTWRSRGDHITRWKALLAAAERAQLDLSLAGPDELRPRVAAYETWLERMLATAGRAYAIT